MNPRKNLRFYTKEEEEEIFIKVGELLKTDVKKAELVIMEIFYKFEPLIKKIVRKNAGYGIDQEILMSEATVAFLEAVKRFDLSQGFRFSTYLQSYVRGMLFTLIMKEVFPVTVSANSLNKKMFFSLKRQLAEILQETGSTIVTNEVLNLIAEKNGTTPDRVKDLLFIMENNTVPLDKPAWANGSSDDQSRGTIGDTIGDGVDVFQNLLNASKDRVTIEILSEALTVLDDRENFIIKKQIYCEDDEEETLINIAKNYNISKERVRQIREKSLSKLAGAIKRIMHKKGIRYDELMGM